MNKPLQVLTLIAALGVSSVDWTKKMVMISVARRHNIVSRNFIVCWVVQKNHSCKGGDMKLTVETEQETDGRWIAEITELPGVMKYGGNRDEAVAQAEALALRVIADRIEHGERPVEPIEITFVTA